jgi:hypothetical protein
MKALSIREPWAWLILHAGKDIENRNWSCPARGRIAIHASKTFDQQGYEYVRREFLDIVTPEPDEFQLGGIVGTVEHRGCVTDFFSRWFFGPVGHVLSDPKPCLFVPWPGRLFFFQVPDSVISYVMGR